MFKRQIPQHAYHIVWAILILQFTMLTTNSIVDLNGKATDSWRWCTDFNLCVKPL